MKLASAGASAGVVSLLFTALALMASAADDGKPVAVEPAELTRRADLVGHEVAVDDRVGRFQFHPEHGFDELYLKRCPDVTFALPPRLRTKQPQSVAVRVIGVLNQREGKWSVDVTALELLPSDLDRLNRSVAQLPKGDVETRAAWARWAEGRARAFQDDALLKRAREVEADSVRAQADKPVRDRNPSDQWIALAERARQRALPEPEPSALAHKGFRAKAVGLKSAADLAALAGRIQIFLPASKEPLGPDSAAEADRWERAYANDPAAAYRSAPPAARAALDRRLWADVTRSRIERQAADDPHAALALAAEAARTLPDRPDLALTLAEKGVAARAKDLAGIEPAELEALGNVYRDTLKQPDKARELERSWLENRRVRLPAGDAETRLTLADQFERLLADRETAVALVREAEALDAGSPQIADAFRRRGFRKEGGRWVERRPTTSTGDNPPQEDDPDDRDRPPTADRRAGGERTAPDPGSDSLLGATPEQVRARLGGKPNRRSWCAVQGQVVEQWVYAGPRQDQYVTFLRRAGERHPRVTASYALSRSEAGRSAP